MDKWKLHHFYNSIPIPKRLKNDILNENRKQITYIKNISKLNIFVGENNSGKSLLLREILKSNWKHHYSEEILQEIELKYTTLTTKLKNIFFLKNIYQELASTIVTL